MDDPVLDKLNALLERSRAALDRRSGKQGRPFDEEDSAILERIQRAERRLHAVEMRVDRLDDVGKVLEDLAAGRGEGTFSYGTSSAGRIDAIERRLDRVEQRLARLMKS